MAKDSHNKPPGASKPATRGKSKRPPGRPPSEFCPRGHRMTGANLLWHIRYDAKGKQHKVRECRACANRRSQINRLVAKQNRELAQREAAAIAQRIAQLMGEEPPKKR